MKQLLSVFIISCFVHYNVFAHEPLLSQPIQEKSDTQTVLAHIRYDIQTEKWKDLCALLKTSLHRKEVRFYQLAALAQSFPSTPFAHAVQATKSILAINERTNLSPKILLPIALFAETYLQEEVLAGHHYFPKSLFGRSCEYDPEEHHFIINLSGIKPLGQGKSKTVFKSILYDRIHPKIVANGLTKKDVSKEVFAMKSLLGEEGVIQALALLSYKHHSSKKIETSIVTPIYNQGALYSVLRNKKAHLTFNERLSIAQCLITGLANMHKNGFVHRDLGAKNHFVHFENLGHHKRKVTAVIADLGRARALSGLEGVSVQGNAFNFSPEGFFPAKLKEKDYCASDVFALGCVFWNLYFDKLPDWSRPRFVKRKDWSMKKRYHAHLSLLKKTRKPYVTYLQKKKARHEELSKKDIFLAIILKMTRPNPKSRGSAESIKKELLLLS